MSYINANKVLPEELIKEIQVYVNGVNLYIPKVLGRKGTYSSYRQETEHRNKEIYARFQQGAKISELASVYYLSDKSIYRILGQMKET